LAFFALGDAATADEDIDDDSDGAPVAAWATGGRGFYLALPDCIIMRWVKVCANCRP